MAWMNSVMNPKIVIWWLSPVVLITDVKIALELISSMAATMKQNDSPNHIRRSRKFRLSHCALIQQGTYREEFIQTKNSI